jgi:amidophosphoribosyltransferase
MSGVFGVASKENCMNMLVYGTDYHSHLGTEFGGLAVLGEKFDRRIHNISQSQFKSKFYEDQKEMVGHKGIGVISDSNEQPMYLRSRFGEFCIVTVGLIENQAELAEELLKDGETFSEVATNKVNTTELIAKLINRGKSLVDGIEKMFDVIKGSCSLLLLHRDGVYAARDRWGYTPLAIGQKNGAWAVATESSSFLNLGFKLEKHLLPGEIVLLTEKGMESERRGSTHEQICTFLWIYTGFPASNYEGINVELAREHCGAMLAKRDKDIQIDQVAGVPDSGVAHAVGYAMESKKPFRRPLVKYTPGYGRSYTPPSQETRDLIATMKLQAIQEVVEGERIVLCEDSIVRGTQLKNFAISKLWSCGAKEIHVRPACPPLMFPCRFCLSTRNISELAARRAIKAMEGLDPEDLSEYLDHRTEKYKKMVEWIRKDLEVTTLRYQHIDDMVKAVGLPREKLCLYCWNGECPGDKKVSKKVTKGSGKK